MPATTATSSCSSTPPVSARSRPARSPGGVARLDALLSTDSVAGEPLRDPTRWDVVTRLLELGALQAEARFTEQEKRDTTADGRRLAFVAGAGRPGAEVKRTYFT